MQFYRISIPVYSYILICSSSFIWHLVLWNRLTWDSVMWRSIMSSCYVSSRVNMIVLYDILCYIVLCDHVTWSSYMNSCQPDCVTISYVISCCVIMLRDRLTWIRVNVIVLYEIIWCYLVMLFHIVFLPSSIVGDPNVCQCDRIHYRKQNMKYAKARKFPAAEGFNVP